MVNKQVYNFSCPLSNGLNFELFNTLKNGPVIMIFIEDSWSPTFDKHVKKLMNYLEKRNMRNKSTLLVVAPLSAKEINDIKNQNNLNMLMLCDHEREVIDRFGIKFPHVNLSTPYTVVIGQNQKIASYLGFEQIVA